MEVRKGFVIPVAVAFILWAGGFFKTSVENFVGDKKDIESTASRMVELKESNKRNWDKYNELETKFSTMRVDVSQVETNVKDIARLENHVGVMEGRMQDARETNAAQQEAIHKLQIDIERHYER